VQRAKEHPKPAASQAHPETRRAQPTDLTFQRERAVSAQAQEEQVRRRREGVEEEVRLQVVARQGPPSRAPEPATESGLNGRARATNRQRRPIARVNQASPTAAGGRRAGIRQAQGVDAERGAGRNSGLRPGIQGRGCPAGGLGRAGCRTRSAGRRLFPFPSVFFRFVAESPMPSLRLIFLVHIFPKHKETKRASRL
jgi:hypothetical protein